MCWAWSSRTCCFAPIPNGDEGELSRRLADLVRRETCAEVAEKWACWTPGWARGRGRASGRLRKTVLGDVCEAVIGAIYLDGGYPAAQKMIERPGASGCASRCGRCATRRRCCRNGRRAGACRRPPIARSSGPGRTTIRNSAWRSNFLAWRLRGQGSTKRAAEKAAALRSWREGVRASAPMVEAAQGTRCGFVALIGAPNAGKSTLVNALVGSKVTIVSNKVQTTRALIRGIASRTLRRSSWSTRPVSSRPRRLDRAMVTTAWGGAQDADLVALLLDARRGIDEEADAILDRLGRSSSRRCSSSTRSTRSRARRCWRSPQRANERLAFDATFMVSAMTGDGVDDLLDSLAEALPEGPFLYPEDQMSDLPMRQLAAEITREKIYRRLHQELPYRRLSRPRNGQRAQGRLGAHRADDLRRARKPAEDRARQGGETIKAIGADARKRTPEIVGQPVHLFLFVKVRENWGRRPGALPRDGARVSEGMSGQPTMIVPRGCAAFRGAALRVADSGRADGGLCRRRRRGAGIAQRGECVSDHGDFSSLCGSRRNGTRTGRVGRFSDFSCLRSSSTSPPSVS